MVAQTGPRYQAMRMGDEYVLVPQNPVALAEHAGWLLGGASLLALGLFGRGLVGLAIKLAGAGLLYRGVTGTSPLGLLGMGRRAGEGGAQQPADEVEQASMESFPASDAPARR